MDCLSIEGVVVVVDMMVVVAERERERKGTLSRAFVRERRWPRLADNALFGSKVAAKQRRSHRIFPTVSQWE